MTAGRVQTHPPSTHDSAVGRDEFVLPASSAQQRLWVVDGLRPGNPAYNIPAVFELRGALDLDALEQSVADLVRRHEALRTTFRDAADGLRQVIVPEVVSQPVELVDLTGVAPEERPPLRTELVQEFVRRVFDLRTGPLIAVAVFQWSGTEYTLLVNVHHAVADGWSMGVLLRELSQLYAVRVEGEEPTLPPLELQYGDYAVWQQKRLEAGAFESQVDYWRQALAGAPPAIELPTDRPRPPLKTFDGGVEWLELTAGELAAVKAFARTQQVTPFLLLLAACAVVLGRYSRQEDLLIGTPLADRSRSETEALIGFLINTVVLRVDLSENPSIRELLRRLRDATAGAAANHDLPFDKVVEALRPERDLSRTPVFQVMVAYQPDPLESLSLTGIAATSIPAHNGTSKFDLLIGFEEHSSGLRGLFEYSTDLFDGPTVRRLAGHIRVVLAALISNQPDRRIGELPMLTPEERQQVVVDWNDTRTDDSSGECIHHFVRAQAARTPTAPAVIHADKTLSYGELHARVARLAAHLRSIGVGRGSLVGVCLERSPELIITVLAVLEAGAAYVPLDPAYPQERLRFILEDTGAAVVVTSAKVRDALPPHHARLVDVGAITGDHTAQATDDGLEVGGDDLAYVIYTSGSTGRPKGVALEHRTAVAMIRWARAVYSDADLAGVLASTSICFDLSVFEMFVPLSWGGAVVLAENALQLPHLAAAGDVTLINTVPSAMAELLRMDTLPTGLRVAILAGERLRPALVDEILARTSIGRVFDVYGPSETSYTTCASRSAGAPETIGRPLPGVQTYVLDSHRNPVPIGVPGELYIGGTTVARGYLHRPELTAERFLANPFDVTGARMYASGDRARWRPDGSLEYLGRADHQVKLRGYRIEPGEVEATLRRHVGVTDAVVVVREDAPGDQRLVAYVVATGPPREVVADVRGWLKTELPDFMIPSAVVLMTALPLTPNGKVDRGKLPAPEPAAPRAGIVAPRSDTERRLAEIWASVLQVEPHFGVEDDFFDLGGHSLLAIRVVARIRQILAVDIGLDQFFADATIGGLGRLVDARQRAAADPPSLAPAPVVEPAAPAPLSFAQQRMWILDQLDPTGTAYVIPSALRIRGPLDVPRLEGALRALVNRHEALRTTFQLIDGELQQVVGETTPWALPMVALADPAPDEAALEELLRAEASRRFDLSRGPLFRACLYRMSQDSHVLLLVMHHIVSDGWSMGLLFEELGVLYTGGLSASLTPLALQYRDATRWQRRWLQGEVLDSQSSYWRRRLAGAPQWLDLPTHRTRPAIASHRGALYSLMVPRHLVDRLQRLSRQEGTTLFMTLVAGFSALLARYSGRDDLLIGTPVANRQRAEFEGVVGCFVNTLVLRADLSGDPTVREHLARIRTVCLEAFANQDLPFERVVEDLHATRDLSHNALFQVMFGLQNAPSRPADLGGLDVAPIGLDLHAAQFDLSVLAWETTDGLRADFSYATDLFDPATIARLAEHWRAVLEGIVSAPECRVGDLGLLDATERHRALVDWNRTAREFPHDASVSRLFEAQVEKAPDATAVVVGEERVSYRALNRRSNRLASYLRAEGIPAGAHVAVCMERSADFVVAMLAVLKAGCAYVPLDPGNPAPRLRFLLEDAAAVAILTHSRTAASWSGDAPLRIDVDDRAGELATLPDDNPTGAAQGGDLAYVMYTSGSTGRPKGVAIPHRAIVRLVVNTNYVAIGRDDVVAQVSNQAFDAATFEVWGALLSGATLDVIDRETLLSPRLLAQAIRERRVSTMLLTPALFNAIASHEPSAFAPMKQLLVGGDVVEPRWAAEVLRSGAPGRLLNVYGPTEATTIAAWYEIDLAAAAGATIPIGRPIANTTLHVLDDRLQPVPVGVTGELYIGGPGLACGYLNDEALTQRRFITASCEGGVRLYRTGDAARYREDGNIEFRGRVDTQVKLRGFRVEPGEVEATLTWHPRVASAAVVVREDEPGDKRLVAYVVGAQPGSGSLVEDARAWLATQLPDHMVPASLVELSALPLMANGKLDRAALPAPERSSAATGPQAPRTPTEEVLAGIWADVLRLDTIAVDDNFFEVGGHSLTALQVFARIQRQFGLGLPLATLFEAPTVARLAAILDAATSLHGGPRETSPLRPDAAVQSVAAGGGDRGAAGTTAGPGLSIDTIRRSPCLAAIRPSGSKPPFFVLPGAGGNTLGFQAVARHLDPDRPLIGLESLGRDGRDVPLTNLQAIAARFVHEMRSLQPEGPYALGGISFGGMVALEIAQQLLASGQRVSLLALLDTVLGLEEPEKSPASWSTRAGALGQRLRRTASALLLGSEGDRIGYLRIRARRLRWRFTTRRWHDRNEIHTVAARIDNGEQLPITEALRHVRQANLLAYRTYRPVHYHDAITLFYATQREDGDAAKAKWRAMCDRLTVHPVPGDHTTMMDEPNVQVLARKLSEALDLAHRETLEHAPRA